MKESLSSENFALEILKEIESAIIKIKDRFLKPSHSL